MNLLAITSQTWLVTFLGFGIVLILLCAFVFLMQGLGAIMQWLENKALQPATCNLQPAKSATCNLQSGQPDAATTAAIAKTLELAGEDTDMAAVAMALNLYYGVHDIEAPKLTILGHSTQWNSNKF